MPAYNFQKRFAAAVKNGHKRRTIRKPRKRRTVAGDTLYMYCDQRTPDREKLGVFKCTQSSDVIIDHESVTINGSVITSPALLDEFARKDFIDNFSTMKRFFENLHGPLPFKAIMIEW